ncbi:MAG: hypothetical protein AB4042_06445 [Leptolyngbyaceae cyanobacterium]
MKQPILDTEKSYTFSDYFDLSYPTKEIVAEFGYQLQFQKVELPRYQPDRSLESLKNTFYKKLPHISLNSETAKREVLIAPVLLELLDFIDVDINIEYPLHVNHQLKGNIDYLVRGIGNLVVIEAKKADLERGFSQLAVELIAIDHYLSEENIAIYGAVTVGDLWRFGVLQRQQKTILKDIDSYRVPADLDDLFAVLLGILKP